MDATAFFTGFAVSGGLIVAIGAQNAYVLRQALRGEHAAALALQCMLSDAFLFGAAIAGFGAALAADGRVLRWVTLVGAVFLAGYGLRALAGALRTQSLAVPADAAPPARLAQVLATGALLTFGNPHVYVDLVLVGTVGSRFAEGARWLYALGAMSASVAWFCSLVAGARLLAPLFARPLAWRVLDLTVGGTMLLLAASLAAAG